MSTVATDHALHVETAFLQLAFALKLWHYAADGNIPLEKFDIPLIIKDGAAQINLPGCQFNTPADLVLATENGISVAFGTAVKTLWEAVNEKTSYGKHNPMQTENEKLAGLTYMLRCCFAHGTAMPRWKIDSEKYKTLYRIGAREVDLRVVSGKLFSYETIGGHDTLWLLRSELELRGMI